jgi:parallel beta-helix repeat protein
MRQAKLVLLLSIVAAFACPASVSAGTVNVATADQLRNAVAAAGPGDTIVMAPGVYVLASPLTLENDGMPPSPIVLRSAQALQAIVRSTTVEAMRITGSDWHIEGLRFEGACATDDQCEHALHILSGADRFALRDSVLRDFNAPIKGNGEPLGAGGSYVFADDVLIERNTLGASRARNTANPVTFIDVVGGQRWHIRDNLIHDFRKALGNQISYGAFLKGNGSDGVFERNLVMCERDFSGGVRIGLSFGGGGTGAQFCEGGSCATEHRRGVMRNNIIVNCSDVGIYLNLAQDTLIDHNTLYDTYGIDVRFATSSATLRNNLLTTQPGDAAAGAIRSRNGGVIVGTAGNLVQQPIAAVAGWFRDPARGDFALVNGSVIVDQGVVVAGVTDDFCGDDRQDGAADIGAIEYDGQADCATALDSTVFGDGFED